MVKDAFALFLSLTVALAGLVGCSSPGTVIVPTTAKTTVPTSSTLVTVSDQVIPGGKSLDIPSGGVPVKAGHALTLSWSADGALECRILTANQYSQYIAFKQSGKQSSGASSGASHGIIRENVQNDDTFYAILINNATAGPSVRLYQATLTEQ